MGMLSNKVTSAVVEKMMRDCAAILNESVQRVMDTCPDEEFEAYRSRIGQIMGAIYLDVMRPIYRQYADLEPMELRDSHDGGPQGTN